MKKDLRVALVQYDIDWKEKTKNFRKISHLLTGLESSVDLIVLPETFNTGFVMDDLSVAEGSNGNSVNWLKTLSERYNCLVMGSIISTDGEFYYNRLYAVDEKGNIEVYDKRHLFSLGSEHKNFKAGTDKIVITYKHWKICPLICYDLRFPVWSRNNGDYDCLVYVANWPEVRSYAWKTLLKARSIENQCYTLGVNRIGEDDNGITHSGDSCAIDPMGNSISSLHAEEGLVVSTLSHSRLDEIRNQLPFLNDRDGFKIEH
jgi:predicted amidohydrolase